jgi:predicted Zn-dependent protease
VSADASVAATDTVRRLELVPAGGLSLALLAGLGRELDRRFGTVSRVGEPLALDPGWRCGEGGGERYLSTPIVDAVMARLDARGLDHATHWALAVTEAELCAPGLESVIGEATVGGCCAVVGLARLRAQDGRSAATLRRRLVTEAVHELGHVAGLEHCADPRCVMYPSRDIADTDRKGGEFCRRCRAELAASISHASLDPARACD